MNISYDEECVWVFALRYALPRETTASSSVSGFLRENMSRIRPSTLRQMAREIEMAIEHGTSGSPIDVSIWRKLADDITNYHAINP